MPAANLVTESKTWRAVHSLIQDRLPITSACLVDTNYGGAFPLSGFRIIVGRSKESHFFLEDEEVSRRHAQITCHDGRFFIEDLGSTNGTLLNGKVASKRERLLNGDIIRFGRSIFAFQVQTSPSFSFETAPLAPGHC
jgi:pSer/pThr/pTyr-binding forkhead associated (FHA) protein